MQSIISTKFYMESGRIFKVDVSNDEYFFFIFDPNSRSFLPISAFSGIDVLWGGFEMEEGELPSEVRAVLSDFTPTPTKV